MVIISFDLITIKLNNHRLFHKTEVCKKNKEQSRNTKEMHGEHNKKMFI